MENASVHASSNLSPLQRIRHHCQQKSMVNQDSICRCKEWTKVPPSSSVRTSTILWLTPPTPQSRVCAQHLRTSKPRVVTKLNYHVSSINWKWPKIVLHTAIGLEIKSLIPFQLVPNRLLLHCGTKTDAFWIGMDKHRNATLFSKMESNEGEMEKL